MYRKPLFVGLVLLAIVAVSALAVSAGLVLPDSDETPTSAKRGSIVGGNTYSNPALGLQISLPGKWHFMPPVPRPESTSGCRGPLCGNPEIEATLEPDSDPTQKLGLIAYKLSSRYLNRERYPLKKFAELMTLNSLGGSNWVSLGGLDLVQFGGRPTYRLLVRDQNISTKKGFAYVSESNGYIYLIVGGDGSSSQNLRQAVENMKITLSFREPRP